MNFCKYGTQKTIGRGIYYICSKTTLPCKFARWCSSEQIYKPNANFNSCSLKNEPKKEAVVAVPQEQKQVKRKRKSKKIEPELVENINEEDIGID